MYKKLICSMTLVLVLALAGTTAQAATPFGTIPTGWSVVAQWHFDEGSGQTVSDASGYGWNGYLGISDANTTYDPNWTSPGYNGSGSALDFDFTDDMATVPNQGLFHPGSNVHTLMVDAWVKQDSVTGWQGIVDAPDSSDTDRYLLFTNNGSVRFAVAGQPLDGGTITTGSWYRITGVFYDAAAAGQANGLGVMEIYVNGALVASWDEHPGSLSSTGNEMLTFSNTYSGAGSYPFNGLIDEVTISTSAVACNPDPPDGGLIPYHSRESAALDWSPGVYAATHDVYLGTDFNDVSNASRLAGDVDGTGPVDWNDIEIVAKQWLQDPPCDSEPYADVNDDDNVNLADFAVVANDWMASGDAEFKGNQAGTTYDPCGLELDKTYYWRIDEVNNCNGNSPWKGDIWSFDVVSMTVQDFGGGAGQTPYTTRICGSGSGPGLFMGTLQMVNGINQLNVVAFDQNDANGLYGRIVAEWDFRIDAGEEGYGFALLNTAVYGTSGAGTNTCINWDEPSAVNSFGVGFDIDDPYVVGGFSEYEVSLHWDGRERANARSPFDFGDEIFRPVRVEVDFVTGGANVSVSISEIPVYTNYFLAGMTPYDSRVAFGARTGASVDTFHYLDNIRVAFKEPMASAPNEPNTVQTFVQELIYSGNWMSEAYFDFPTCGTTYGRVVLRAILEAPVGGSDPIDRLLKVEVWDDGGQMYEIARLGTPFGGAGWTWWIDVTDYQWLLCGNKKLRISSGFDKGWLVTTDFDFYEGAPEYKAYRAENLWSGTPNYGECSGVNPIDAFFAPINLVIDPNAERVKLRFVVTGHGDNNDDAAEFLKRGRTVDVNNGSYYNLLWRDDCYLNPCRPQSGTWRTSRAGWCPGDVALLWEIDITDDVTPGASATIDYDADEYIVTVPSDCSISNPSRHKVESQIIYYRTP